MREQGDTLGRLMRWYASHCDGEWEHGSGIRIDSLDNPGWSIRIDLEGTGLDRRPFARVAEGEDADNYDDRGNPIGPWLCAWADASAWHAACSPDNLERALSVFLDWAEGGR